mgnify:CR=1 FL=1
MKTVQKILILCLATTFLACSNEESIDDLNDSANEPKSNLTIKAKTTYNETAGRAKVATNFEIDQFLINIRKIEFKFSDDSKSFAFQGKSDDDNDLNFDELPIEIQDYITTNHPNDPFCKAKEEDDSSDDPYKYKVELASGLELYFRADFTLYAQEQDDSPCNDDDNDGDDSNSYGDDDEFQLAGPFEINLLDNESTTIINIDIPVGEYEEVEFKMDKSENPNSILFQKSIMITGTLDGTPMTFYHTFDEDFEIDYEDAGQNLIIDESNNNEVTFNFDLNAVVNLVNLDAAKDGNNDGMIEISPIDSDGNNALANNIKNAIVQFAELID